MRETIYVGFDEKPASCSTVRCFSFDGVDIAFGGAGLRGDSWNVASVSIDDLCLDVVGRGDFYEEIRDLRADIKDVANLAIHVKGAALREACKAMAADPTFLIKIIQNSCAESRERGRREALDEARGLFVKLQDLFDL